MRLQSPFVGENADLLRVCDIAPKGAIVESAINRWPPLLVYVPVQETDVLTHNASDTYNLSVGSP